MWYRAGKLLRRVSLHLVDGLTLRPDRLGVESHEIVFLDDHEAHVQAARAYGWHAVWHLDTDLSIQEITRTIEQAERAAGS